MALDVRWFIVLDAASVLLGLLVAAFFLRVYVTTRSPSHLLFAVGMALIGATWGTVTASHFDLGADPDAYDHLRIAGQLGGALVVLFAYLGSRTRAHPKPWIAIGYAAIVVLVFFALVYFGLPPALSFPNRRQDFAIAHAVMAVVWIACALLAGQGSFRLAISGRGFVPAAFALFALSKYTWFIVEAGRAADEMVLLIYPWRFTALGLLLAALALAPKMEAEHGSS